MRVLIVTKIFPNRAEPNSSPFNRQQFSALSRLCGVEILASVPWFPAAGHFRRWSRAGRLLSVPNLESIDGIAVRHPRFVYVPKLGNSVAGPLYAASLARQVLSYRGLIDVVLGSWAYPDGFAAVVFGELLGVPSVVKVHGTDINVLARKSGPKRRLMWALPRAARVVAVSKPLAQCVSELGVAPDRIDVVPNGIDTQLFKPRDRRAARMRLGFHPDKPRVLYVGHIEREKGALDLLSAFGISPLRRSAALSIVGNGGARLECEKLAQRLGVEVDFAGERPHHEVADYLAACDVLALPSWNEGMPNAVLEALASGRKVVASRVGGIPDIVDRDVLGMLVPPKDPMALAHALERTLLAPYDPAEVRAGATILDWSESAVRLLQSLVLAQASSSRKAA